MHEIRFKINPNRPQTKEMDFDFVQRVAQIVVGGNPPRVAEQEQGYHWALGTGNNWWMDKDIQTGEFIMVYRYGGGGNLPKMECLRKTLLWLLHIEPYNKED